MEQIKQTIDKLQEGSNLLPQEPHLESSEVELTPEELNAAIQMAQSVKAANERKKSYWRSVMAPKHADHVTAEELLQDVLEMCEEDGKPLIIDDENREVVTLLSWYFSGDPRFEDAGYSLSKGIYLYGAVGIGKTHLMRQFTTMQRKPFRMVDCSDIAAEHKRDGEDGIRIYFKDNQIHERNYWGHTHRGWCFDDLGTESDSKYFGNQTNVMERIFEVRYRSRESLITHIISNLTADQIESRYGVRIRERLREMMNVIHFTAKTSRRK
jgi:hypothetical protein